jgi:hypothetical protein
MPLHDKDAPSHTREIRQWKKKQLKGKFHFGLCGTMLSPMQDKHILRRLLQLQEYLNILDMLDC